MTFKNDLIKCVAFALWSSASSFSLRRFLVHKNVTKSPLFICLFSFDLIDCVQEVTVQKAWVCLGNKYLVFSAVSGLDWRENPIIVLPRESDVDLQLQVGHNTWEHAGHAHKTPPNLQTRVCVHQVSIDTVNPFSPRSKTALHHPPKASYQLHTCVCYVIRFLFTRALWNWRFM